MSIIEKILGRDPKRSAAEEGFYDKNIYTVASLLDVFIESPTNHPEK